jgi:hypothetical protein
VDANRENFIELANGGNNQIFHKSCDGLITTNLGFFVCKNCGVTWRQHWIHNSATDEDISLRFKVSDVDDENVYRLVQVTESDVTYHTLQKVEDSPKIDDFAKEMEEFFSNFKW